MKCFYPSDVFLAQGRLLATFDASEFGGTSVFVSVFVGCLRPCPMALDASECGGTSVCGTDADELPVDFTNCEGVTCKMCGSRCTDVSPLTSLAEVGKKLQWGQYGKVRDSTGSVVARRPVAQVDALCKNVFYALGLDAEHGTLGEFYKHCCKPENAHKNRNFLQMRHEFIKKHNADPGGTRLKGLPELKTQWRRLLTERIESLTFEEDGDWEFVLKDNWNSALDGEFDPGKVIPRFIFGKTREGIWVRRGREGVYKAKRKETIQTREEAVEDDGLGPFSLERREAKKASITKGVQQFEKERQELHVIKDRFNVEDLLGLVGRCTGPTSAGSAAGAVGSVEDGDGDGDGWSDTDDDDDNHAEGSGAASRLQSLFGGGLPARKKAAAKAPAAKPRVVANASAAVPMSTVRSGQRGCGDPRPLEDGSGLKPCVGEETGPAIKASGRVAAKKGSRSGSGFRPCDGAGPGGSACEVVMLDGRSKRIVESVTETLMALKTKVGEVSFQEELRTGAAKDKRKQLADTLHKKARALSKLEGEVSTAILRVGKSTSKAVVRVPK